MNAEAYVLDTSALLALIEDEPGAERVERILRQENVLLPWLVLMELIYITSREQGEEEAHNRYALIKHLGFEILREVDERVLLTAARLKANHRLSLADAVIAAFAIQQRAILVYKDPEYDALGELVKREALPYKVTN